MTQQPEPDGAMEALVYALLILIGAGLVLAGVLCL